MWNSTLVSQKLVSLGSLVAVSTDWIAPRFNEKRLTKTKQFALVRNDFNIALPFLEIPKDCLDTDPERRAEDASVGDVNIAKSGSLGGGISYELSIKTFDIGRMPW